jgi:sugar O-acyltransferase (sialic acid O-acetyltransferase NeuD family)
MRSDSKDRIVIIGSSGHASVLLDTIESSGGYTVVGFLDDTIEKGTERRSYPVLGKLADASASCAQLSIGCAVIGVGDNWWRRKIYLDLMRVCPGLKFPVVKHPSAVIAASAEINEGTAILAGSHVGPYSQIGKCCIINTGSSLDHDCVLGDFASLAPGAFTGGQVNIGECSAIGVGASISHRISIGSHAVIGTGATVVRHIPDLVVAYGNPARVRRSRREAESYL